MIYAKQHWNLHPASPATRDRFVDTATDAWLPAAESHGAKPVGAWFCHEEWFSQIVHVTGFESLAAWDAYRAAATADGSLAKAHAELDALAADRRTELLETLGPVPEATLDAAIEQAASDPAGVYTLAVLEVLPGKMDAFKGMLGVSAPNLPIVASWRDLTGNPAQVSDLWRGDIVKGGYEPNHKGLDAFFGPLREVAPQERIQRLHPLPYSALK